MPTTSMTTGKSWARPRIRALANCSLSWQSPAAVKVTTTAVEMITTKVKLRHGNRCPFNNGELPNATFPAEPRLKGRMSNVRLPNRVSARGPRSWPLLGHLPFLVFGILKARGNFAEAVRRMVSEYSRRTLYLRVGRKPVVISADPEFARRVLVDHASHFPKTGWEKRVLTPTMDEGLIILEGAEWKQHRAAVAPCFSAYLLEGLGRTVAGATTDRLASWRGSVAIGHEIRCITSDVLTRFFLQDHHLSHASHPSLDEYARSFARVEEGLESRVFDPVGLIDRLRARARGRPSFSDALGQITQVIEEQVSRTVAEAPPRKSVLDLMLSRVLAFASAGDLR